MRVAPISRLAAVVATGALLATGAASAAAAEAFAPPAEYRLVWADEFDADGLPDDSRWAHDTGRNREGWHNRERQYYSGPRAENAVIRNGVLAITARKESLVSAPDFGGQAYTSARLITRGKAEWTYGFFEVRAKMPCGAGTWPAIWTLGSGGRWPDDGEFDILEHMGRDPLRIFSAVHVAAGHAGQAMGGSAKLPTACSAFHTYQMHWTPRDVVFGVDGFSHFRFVKLDVGPRAWPFDAPQFLILNLAIGGDLGGPVDDRIFPVALEVDYVRVYQRARQARP